jgi:NADH dehydrogenase
MVSGSVRGWIFAMAQDLPRKIVVIGGGFAGLWSALGAARKLDELGIGAEDVTVTLINRDSWHGIRVRNYESDLSQVRVPLSTVLPSTGVELIEGDVTGIDDVGGSVLVETHQGCLTVSYDRLILAAGSQVSLPDIPGLKQHGLSIDTYTEAQRLQTHLKALSDKPNAEGRNIVLVVGAGLTGIELACELPERLKYYDLEKARVILADRQPHIGSDMGDNARPVIERALEDLGVETRMSIDVVAIDRDGVTLTDGRRIAAQTVVWCAGMVPNPLAELVPGDRDGAGRLLVDSFMKVKGQENIFAAGDMAAASVDREHLSVMSCQHARPMGRFAGHNAVADLLGTELLALHIPWYSTCLDLGSAGAVRTEGWNRSVVSSGQEAKKIKQTINCVRIYPPLTGNREEILAAADPIVQAPPGRAGGGAVR